MGVRNMLHTKKMITFQESTLATSMFDATVSIVLTGKRSTPVLAPTTVAVSLEVRCWDTNVLNVKS